MKANAMYWRAPSLKWILCLAGMCVWSALAYGADWKVHQSAGFRAFDQNKTAEAVAQFEAATYFAQQQNASDRDLAMLYQNLATAYYADKQYRRSWETIDRWDAVLERNPNADWVGEHLPHRDRLTALLFDAVGKAPDDGASSAAGTATASTQNAASTATAPAESAEAAPPSDGVSGRYAVHLESYRTEQAARTGWAQLKADYPALLDGTSLIVRRADLGERGVFYRVLAGAFDDPARARRLCNGFASRSHYCVVMSLE